MPPELPRPVTGTLEELPLIGPRQDYASVTETISLWPPARIAS